VDESRAWLEQALSDHAAGERFVAGDDDTQWCHAVAKYQQTVEKSIKAVAVAVREIGISTPKIGYTHSVKRLVSALVRPPRDRGNLGIASHLSRLLDHNTRASINSLESLIPQQPPVGQPHHKNTEYPFELSDDDWTFPAAKGVFSYPEVQEFRKLSYRVAEEARRIIAAIRRTPR
jgi:hypothetical protein